MLNQTVGNGFQSIPQPSIFSFNSTQAKSVKPNDISIKVIDSYYQSINNLDEIDRIRYLNDYERLIDQIEKIYKTHHSISNDEKNYVYKYLKDE